MYALRSEEEEQRWRCGGAKTISPLSMLVCVCLNFEDMTPKRQARLWNQVSQRELENIWNQVEKEKKKKKEREREENERAGKLLESNGSKEKKKKKRERAENERAGEIRRKEGFEIKWNVKEKKR